MLFRKKDILNILYNSSNLYLLHMYLQVCTFFYISNDFVQLSRNKNDNKIFIFSLFILFSFKNYSVI